MKTDKGREWSEKTLVSVNTTLTVDWQKIQHKDQDGNGEMKTDCYT